MRKLTITILTLAGVTGFAAGPAQAAGRAVPDCATTGATLTATSTARVYARGADIYACRYGTAKRIRLGSDGECQGDFRATKPRLAGRYVGWVSTTCNLDASDDAVMVADLTTAKVKWTSVAATGDSATSNREVTTFVRDFEMTKRGTAVFLGVFDAGGQTLRIDSPLDLVQLRVLNRSASDGTLIVDEGQEIVPGSLALTAAGFYYRKGGAAIFRPV